MFLTSFAGSRTITRHASFPPNSAAARAGKAHLRDGRIRPVEQSRQDSRALARADGVDGQGATCKWLDER
jgi:hypothetical protein